MRVILAMTRRYRYETIVFLLGAMSAIPYWLARTGQLYPPFWGGVIRNQFGDFCAVPLGTVILLLVGAGALTLQHRVRRTASRPVPLRWKLLAPITAWLVFFGNEVSQKFGVQSRYSGRTFDPRDLLAITLAGVICTVCVACAHKAHRHAEWRPSRQQRTAAVLVAVVAVTLATAGAAGGSGSSGGNPDAAVTVHPENMAGELVVAIDYDGGLGGKFTYRSLQVRVRFRPDEKTGWDDVEYYTYDTTHNAGVDVPVNGATDAAGKITPGQYQVRVTSNVAEKAGSEDTIKITYDFGVGIDGTIEGGDDADPGDEGNQ